MAVATKTNRPTGVSTLYRSTIGKKMIMAVTGLLMLAFVVVHMLGNLKIFFGETEFNHYAAWLRTIGEPVLHNGWYLWVQRAVLLAALLAHIWAAVSLWRLDRRARPIGYQARRKGGWATMYMRTGGILLAAFIVYHLLDLTAGTLNPQPDAEVYGRVVADFNVWYVTLAYTVAMLALALHVAHGLWSAANTLGVRSATRAAMKTFAGAAALVLLVGFLVVPYGVVFGVIN